MESPDPFEAVWRTILHYTLITSLLTLTILLLSGHRQNSAMWCSVRPLVRGHHGSTSSFRI